jgi:hypothetical protein
VTAGVLTNIVMLWFTLETIPPSSPTFASSPNEVGTAAVLPLTGNFKGGCTDVGRLASGDETEIPSSWEAITTLSGAATVTGSTSVSSLTVVGADGANVVTKLASLSSIVDSESSEMMGTMSSPW